MQAYAACMAHCTFIILVWLANVLPASSQKVQWLLSNEWEDVSCDTVCFKQGFSCTEKCWPAALAGLKAVVAGPSLKGTCFQVSSGPAKLWHPAKDADNTNCYWNPGPDATSQARCRVVSKTPEDDVKQGRVTRRLCPCVNQTAAFVSDCGLGAEQAAVLTDPKAPAPAATQSGSSAAITAAPATTTSQTPAPGPAVAVAFTCNLCVAGFAGDDTSLNGRYVRSGETWRLQDYMLTKATSGHWQFQERQTDGKYMPISQGSLKPAGLPPSDVFSTSTGDWRVEFRSCCSIPGASGAADVASAGAEDSGVNGGVIVAIVFSSLALIGIAVIVLAYKFKLHLHLKFFKKPQEKLPHFEEEVSKPNRIDDPPVRLPKVHDLPDPELGNGGRIVSAAASQKLRAAGAAPGLPQVPNALEDHYSHGVYEGPVQPWWGNDNASAPSKSSSSTAHAWKVGDAVRIGGLGPFHGLIGVVETRKGNGLLNVRLSDGRLKMVGPENCEKPDGSQMPALPPELARRSDDLHSTQNSVSRRAEHVDAGAGVTSWLASTPTSKQDHNSGHCSTGNRSANNFAFQRGSSTSASSSAPSPPMPPQRTPQKKAAQPAAKRASSGPPSGHVARQPAASAMSLSPGMRGEPSALQDDLMKDLLMTQKRTEAKLNSLKMQLTRP